MSANSKIEWTDHTFNPWWGCTKVSPGCANCYAETLAKRTGNNVWGDDAVRRFFNSRHWHEPLGWNEKCRQSGTRARVFCGSMCDIMEDRPDLIPHRHRLYDLIRLTPNLDWLLLTKRTENFMRFLPGPWFNYPAPNVWLMTTVESQAQMTRVRELLKIPAVVHGISAEPLLGPLDFGDMTGIEWVIVGGESGPGARPMSPRWVRDLRDQCLESTVPFFFKQWGEWGIPHSPSEMTHFVCACGHHDLNNDDRIAKHRDGDECFDDLAGIRHLGKRSAGKILDNREYCEFPVHSSSLIVQNSKDTDVLPSTT